VVAQAAKELEAVEAEPIDSDSDMDTNHYSPPPPEPEPEEMSNDQSDHAAQVSCYAVSILFFSRLRKLVIPNLFKILINQSKDALTS